MYRSFLLLRQHFLHMNVCFKTYSFLIIHALLLRFQLGKTPVFSACRSVQNGRAERMMRALQEKASYFITSSLCIQVAEGICVHQSWSAHTR